MHGMKSAGASLRTGAFARYFFKVDAAMILSFSAGIIAVAAWVWIAR